MISCGTTKEITKIVYNYKDTTVVNFRDSIIRIEIPVEKIKDVVAQYDTSKLETSVAISTAYVDTMSHSLKHNLFNKDSALETKIKYIEKERIIQKDSIIVKEIPVIEEKIVTKVKFPSSY